MEVEAEVEAEVDSEVYEEEDEPDSDESSSSSSSSSSLRVRARDECERPWKEADLGRASAKASEVTPFAAEAAAVACLVFRGDASVSAFRAAEGARARRRRSSMRDARMSSRVCAISSVRLCCCCCCDCCCCCCGGWCLGDDTSKLVGSNGSALGTFEKGGSGERGESGS